MKRMRITGLNNEQKNYLLSEEEKARQLHANETALQSFLSLVGGAAPQNTTQERLIEQTLSTFLNNSALISAEPVSEGSVSEADSLWENTTPLWRAENHGVPNTPSSTAASSLTSKGEEMNNFSPTVIYSPQENKF